MTMEERSTRVYRQKQMFSKEELTKRESLCIQEEPAYCAAACPLKLDTKAMVGAIAGGDFKSALRLYEKIAPFPHILAAGCEAPCEGKCKRWEAGEGIAIGDLERAVAKFGEKSKSKGLLCFKKKKSAAIFGSADRPPANRSCPPPGKDAKRPEHIACWQPVTKKDRTVRLHLHRKGSSPFER